MVLPLSKQYLTICGNSLPESHPGEKDSVLLESVYKEASDYQSKSCQTWERCLLSGLDHNPRCGSARKQAMCELGTTMLPTVKCWCMTVPYNWASHIWTRLRLNQNSSKKTKWFGRGGRFGTRVPSLMQGYEWSNLTSSIDMVRIQIKKDTAIAQDSRFHEIGRRKLQIQQDFWNSQNPSGLGE